MIDGELKRRRADWTNFRPTRQLFFHRFLSGEKRKWITEQTHSTALKKTESTKPGAELIGVCEQFKALLIGFGTEKLIGMEPSLPLAAAHLECCVRSVKGFHNGPRRRSPKASNAVG